MNKIVSVIMPTYKGEKMIQKAIHSILAQDYENLELIIVDDNGKGSEHQKATEKLINEFDDKRIIYIAHEKNQNGACARNTGLREAKGAYVCFHDDDDLMLPNRISSCVSVLEKNPDFGGVLTDVLCCDEKMTPIRVVSIEKEGDCTRDLFINGMFLGSGSNIFIRKDISDQIGEFDGDFCRHQDVEYMIRFYRIAKTKKTGKIGIIKSKNSTINSPNYSKFKKNEDLFKKKFKEDIEKLDKADQEKFYTDVEYWLKISRALSDKKVLINLKGLKPKEKLLVLALRSKINNTRVFAAIVRKIRQKRINHPKITNQVIKFLEEYK